MDQRGLVSSLFDLSFSHFITPKIQRFLYAVFLVVAGLVSVGTLFTGLGMAGGFFGKVGALIVGIPVAAFVFLLLAMWVRVIMEMLIVAFRAVEYLRDISESVKPGPDADPSL